jgi:hypothetical protein
MGGLLNPALIRSYLGAQNSGLFGPPAPAPGAAVAPSANSAAVPAMPNPAGIGIGGAPPSMLPQGTPVPAPGSVASGIYGGPGGNPNAISAMANPAPNFQAALAAMRGMNPGMFGATPGPSMAGTPGGQFGPMLGAGQIDPRMAQIRATLGGGAPGAMPSLGANSFGGMPFGGINPGYQPPTPYPMLAGLAGRYSMLGGQPLNIQTGWDGRPHVLPPGAMS